MEEERSSAGFGLEQERSDAGFGLEQERRGGGFEMEEERSGAAFRLEQERSGDGLRGEERKSGGAHFSTFSLPLFPPHMQKCHVKRTIVLTCSYRCLSLPHRHKV